MLAAIDDSGGALCGVAIADSTISDAVLEQWQARRRSRAAFRGDEFTQWRRHNRRRDDGPRPPGRFSTITGDPQRWLS